MSRKTVDYGIDLGTTNSAIARMDKRSPRVIRNKYQSDVTPSAVAVAKDGSVLVGQDALRDPKLAPALKFKRLMGTSQTLKMADGSSWSPIDLSAEILKELRASVRRRYDEDLTHAVITVPAMFQQPQCEATFQAAQKAGISAVALLQEPIAAASAYLTDEPEEGYYLVYDLGGGTFDVSLLRVEAGEMIVVAHGGDNFLGGSDFDERIYRWVVNRIEQGYGSQPGLKKGVNRWRLLQECERCKILLTDETQTFIDLSDLELPISRIAFDRAILETLIEDLVDKTLLHIQMRLRDANLKASDVNAIMLVGGPTQMPYIRERLRTELEIPVIIEDPMIVVAQGAAIYASTLPKPHDTTAPAPSDAAVLELHYDSISPDPLCPISGRVTQPASFEGDIRITRSGGDWETGWIALKKGSFFTELSLSEDTITSFDIELRDKSGKLRQVVPASISIRLGTAPAKPVTPYSYGVALDDGSMDVIIESGTPLPAYGRPKEYRTKRTVSAGTDDEFVIYFLEGNSPIARDNVQVGQLRLTGRDFPYTIKAGEQVEVRMRMDESRRLTAKVYIPLLDKEYDIELHSEIVRADLDSLQKELSEARHMAETAWEFADEEERKMIQQSEAEIERLKADLETAHSDEQVRPEEVQQKIAHIKQSLRPVYNEHKISAEHQEVVVLIEQTEELCQQFNDKKGLATLQELRNEAEKCKRLKDLDALEAVKHRVASIFLEHAQKTAEFWAGFIMWLIQMAPSATNPVAYARAVEQAKEALNQGNVDRIRQAIAEARRYLPDDLSAPPGFTDTIIGR